jgi:acylphosphatase
MVSDQTHRRMMVVFEGRVQGVGFRYTVCRLAGPLRITGTVRNLMNGNVELVAEGTSDALQDLLNGILGSHLGRYIRRHQAAWSEARGEFKNFGISY